MAAANAVLASKAFSKDCSELRSCSDIACLKKKYRSLALKYHPDRCSHSELDLSECEERFIACQQCYESYEKKLNGEAPETEEPRVIEKDDDMMWYNLYFQVCKQTTATVKRMGHVSNWLYWSFQSSINYINNPPNPVLNHTIDLNVVQAMMGASISFNYTSYVTCSKCRGSQMETHQAEEECPICGGRGKLHFLCNEKHPYSDSDASDHAPDRNHPHSEDDHAFDHAHGSTCPTGLGSGSLYSQKTCHGCCGRGYGRVSACSACRGVGYNAIPIPGTLTIPAGVASGQSFPLLDVYRPNSTTYTDPHTNTPQPIPAFPEKAVVTVSYTPEPVEVPGAMESTATWSLDALPDLHLTVSMSLEKLCTLHKEGFNITLPTNETAILPAPRHRLHEDLVTVLEYRVRGAGFRVPVDEDEVDEPYGDDEDEGWEGVPGAKWPPKSSKSSQKNKNKQNAASQAGSNGDLGLELDSDSGLDGLSLPPKGVPGAEDLNAVFAKLFQIEQQEKKAAAKGTKKGSAQKEGTGGKGKRPVQKESITEGKKMGDKTEKSTDSDSSGGSSRRRLFRDKDEVGAVYYDDSIDMVFADESAPDYLREGLLASHLGDVGPRGDAYVRIVVRYPLHVSRRRSDRKPLEECVGSDNIPALRAMAKRLELQQLRYSYFTHNLWNPIKPVSIQGVGKMKQYIVSGNVDPILFECLYSSTRSILYTAYRPEHWGHAAAALLMK